MGLQRVWPGRGGEETVLEDLQISTPNFLGKGPAPVLR